MSREQLTQHICGICYENNADVEINILEDSEDDFGDITIETNEYYCLGCYKEIVGECQLTTLH